MTSTSVSVPQFLRENRNDNLPVLQSLFGQIAIRGVNTLDHNNSIGRYVWAYAILYFS